MTGVGQVLHLPQSYTNSILRACARGEREYCHTADTTSRAPARCVYEFGRHVKVVVQELQVAEGGLGWRVWVGALVLAQWMAEHAAEFEGKRVLELGSGLGLVGLVAAQLGAVEVVVSDCLAPLVQNLALNAALNPCTCVVRVCAVDVRASLGDAVNAGTRCSTEEFVNSHHAFDAGVAWLNAEEEFDVVLGSEILYESCHAITVAEAMARHLRRRGVPAARAFLLYVNRDHSFLCPAGILWAFVCSARARGLCVRVTASRQRGVRGPLSATFSPADSESEAERARAAMTSPRPAPAGWPSQGPQPAERSAADGQSAERAATADEPVHLALLTLWWAGDAPGVGG